MKFKKQLYYLILSSWLLFILFNNQLFADNGRFDMQVIKNPNPAAPLAAVLTGPVNKNRALENVALKFESETHQFQLQFTKEQLAKNLKHYKRFYLPLIGFHPDTLVAFPFLVPNKSRNFGRI